MPNSFDKISGRFADLLNAIDDAKSASDVTDYGVEFLDTLESEVEKLVQWYDIAFEANKSATEPRS